MKGVKGDRSDKVNYCRTMERNHRKAVKGTVRLWCGTAWCGTVWLEAGRGEAREAAKMERSCGSVCVWRMWLCLAARACIGSGLARSFVVGGVVWLWLNVDVDGSGGSEGGGSRMKGKRKKKDLWLDEWKGKTHHDVVRKNCGAYRALAQIFEGVHDWHAGPFLSPAHNPVLQVGLETS